MNFFVTSSLRPILSYHWQDHVSNDRVLREAGIVRTTCRIRERQLHFSGHAARLLAEDPTHRILSARDLGGWSLSGVLVSHTAEWVP